MMASMGVSSPQGKNTALQRLERLLDELFAHQRRPEFIYRHQWRLGDLVFWDNRCTIHIALGGIEAPGIRHLHRTSIAGDAPF